MTKEQTNGTPNNSQTILSNSKEHSDLPPLIRTLKCIAQANTAGFHFPGHNKGQGAPRAMVELIGEKPFLHDITEHPEQDRFFSPKGPLLEAKKLAAELFGAKETWFLVGGTSCGVQAAIMAACSPGETIVLPRNAHLSAIGGVVLSGAVPKYIVPEYSCDWDVAGGVTPKQVETAIIVSKSEGTKVGAVFVTSPTYNGICSDLSEISKLCHSHGVPLIVDEAHGAHFKFHPNMPMSALDQGADIVIQSTHKVLCSLTQSSMIHISKDHNIDRERLHKSLHLLQSTSPSWLLLASLDAARHELSKGLDTLFYKAVALATEATTLIKRIPGISVLDLKSFPDFPSIDPLRLTISFRQLGISGFEANDILSKDHGVDPEVFSAEYAIFVFNLGTTSDHVKRLVSGLESLSAMFSPTQSQRRNVVAENAPFDNLDMRLTPREAFFAGKMKLRIEECVGEICGETICPYPPGIPVLVPGEIITEKALNYLQQVREEGGFIFGADDPLLSSIVVCKSSIRSN